jgi:hypothetical protein
MCWGCTGVSVHICAHRILEETHCHLRRSWKCNVLYLARSQDTAVVWTSMYEGQGIQMICDTIQYDTDSILITNYLDKLTFQHHKTESLILPHIPDVREICTYFLRIHALVGGSSKNCTWISFPLTWYFNLGWLQTILGHQGYPSSFDQTISQTSKSEKRETDTVKLGWYGNQLY